MATPWGQARSLVKVENGNPPRMPCSRSDGYWVMLGYTLSQIGMLLEDPAVIRLGERQFQFSLGKNLVDASMIHGISDREVGGGSFYFWRRQFVEDWLKSDRKLYTFDGMVPTQSMRFYHSDKVRWAKGDSGVPPLIGGPAGYAGAYLQADYPIHPMPTPAQSTATVRARPSSVRRANRLRRNGSP